MQSARLPLFLVSSIAVLSAAPLAAQAPPNLTSSSVALGTLSPTTLDVGDVNGDGVRDLIVCGKTTTLPGAIGLLLGDGLGGFFPPTVLSLSTAVAAAATGDLNGDGKIDLVAALDPVTAAGSLQPLLGNG